jgi:hypothetical protein
MFEAQIHAHMDVADANGQHVGIVEGVEGDTIRLIQGGPPDDWHFPVPMSAVERIEGDRLYLKADTFLPKITPPGVHSHTQHDPGSNPLFGTSGHGTGMGGSGVGH